jgi:hypothetical protein
MVRRRVERTLDGAGREARFVPVDHIFVFEPAPR